jgi:hypothetical protein
MTDEQALYAGDLTTGLIGREIRVMVNGTTTITDRLRAVKHEERLNGDIETVIWFNNTINQGATLGGDGYHVDYTTIVTVS